ncbi:hypothetical protein [Sneathiella sp.]|jgi:hypothetical protein|uniref:hypothetical protein n=1 Tax=Sneathiella sp. TaxID=1964365 RepID=UPI0039E37562
MKKIIIMTLLCTIGFSSNLLARGGDGGDCLECDGSGYFPDAGPSETADQADEGAEEAAKPACEMVAVSGSEKFCLDPRL